MVIIQDQNTLIEQSITQLNSDTEAYFILTKLPLILSVIYDLLEYHFESFILVVLLEASQLVDSECIVISKAQNF